MKKKINNYMKDITVIIPIHELSVEYYEMLEKAIENINEMEYEGTVRLIVVIPEPYDYPVLKGWDDERYSFVSNPGETDFCSQINFAVPYVTSEYFCIMEVDDRFNRKWFKMFNEYIDNSGFTSIYLPVNVVTNNETGVCEFANHIAWSTGFTSSNENADVADAGSIGYVTFNSIQDNIQLNLTGGIFKTSDWLKYKSSLKVAFNYEYLLRATYKKQKVFVVPKEGYYHQMFRNGSLSKHYIDSIGNDEIEKWFEVAKREYPFDEDRKSEIIKDKKDVLK